MERQPPLDDEHPRAFADVRPDPTEAGRSPQNAATRLDPVEDVIRPKWIASRDGAPKVEQVDPRPSREADLSHFTIPRRPAARVLRPSAQ